MQRLPGHKDSCLTCLAMVDEEDSKGGTTSRLFSSGLDGALVEWDVEQRRAGPAADSLGGAVWQLAPEPGACIKSGERRAAGGPLPRAASRCLARRARPRPHPTTTSPAVLQTRGRAWRPPATTAAPASFWRRRECLG